MKYGLAFLTGWAGFAVVSCTALQQTKAVAAGQLFCARATADGPLIEALTDAAGVPIIVTGLAASVVSAACASVGAIPVSPPAAPAQAPVVAAPVTVAPAGVTTVPPTK